MGHVSVEHNTFLVLLYPVMLRKRIKKKKKNKDLLLGGWAHHPPGKVLSSYNTGKMRKLNNEGAQTLLLFRSLAHRLLQQHISREVPSPSAAAASAHPSLALPLGHGARRGG